MKVRSSRSKEESENMSEKIIQPNENAVKAKLKKLVRKVLKKRPMNSWTKKPMNQPVPHSTNAMNSPKDTAVTIAPEILPSLRQCKTISAQAQRRSF